MDKVVQFIAKALNNLVTGKWDGRGEMLMTARTTRGVLPGMEVLRSTHLYDSTGQVISYEVGFRRVGG